MEREAPSSVVSRRGCFKAWLGVALVWSLTTQAGRAQGEPRLIEPLKLNAVRIEAAWASGNAQYGFGFIVGERASTQLYIATANHVVRDRDRGRSTGVKVWLRGEGAAISAELLDDSSQVLDLAVLRVAKPQGFSWKADVLGSADEQKARGYGRLVHRAGQGLVHPGHPWPPRVDHVSSRRCSSKGCRCGSVRQARRWWPRAASSACSSATKGYLLRHSDREDSAGVRPVEFSVHPHSGCFNDRNTAATSAVDEHERRNGQRRSRTGEQRSRDGYPSVPVVASRMAAYRRSGCQRRCDQDCLRQRILESQPRSGAREPV